MEDTRTLKDLRDRDNVLRRYATTFSSVNAALYYTTVLTVAHPFDVTPYSYVLLCGNHH